MGIGARTSKLFCLLAWSLLAATSQASGPGPGNIAPGNEASDVASTNYSKEERAVKLYTEGYRMVQHAEEFAAQSSSNDDKAWKESQKTFKASLKKFNSALKQNPRMHEAYTYIGYSNRKIGNYTDSLAAYEQALKLKPDYPPALEYQGEAFLGVNRLDDAKSNYQRLFTLDPGEAHKLLKAMKVWANDQAAQPPEGVDIDALKTWLIERENAHDPNDMKSRW